ncbi:MAG: sensor histidine kinase [Saprospiraceae bacterium]|nr:sensor histidine kinase [Saprospiraceae bacterium]
MANLKIKISVLLCVLLAGFESYCSSGCDSLYYKPFIEAANTFQNYHQHKKVIVLVDSLASLQGVDEKCKYYLALLHLKALALEHSQKFEESSELLSKIIKTAQKNNLPETEAKSYLTLVRMHDFLKRKSDLKRNLLLAKSLIDKFKLNHLLPEYYVRSSSYNRFFGTKDSSIYYAHQAIIWGEKYDDYLNLADANLLLGANNRGSEKAIPYVLKSGDYFKKIGSNSSVALQYINVIKTLKDLGKIKETGKYIDSAKVYLQNLEKTPRVYDINEYLCELISSKFEVEGQADSAIYYIKLARLYSDSSLFVTNQQYISDKELEIATLKERAYIENLTKSRRIWIGGFIILLLCILILSYLFYHKSKYQKMISDQNKEILIQKNELDHLLTKQTMLLSEVHHRVKNNLQVVISLLSMKGQSSKNSETIQFFEDICMKIKSISLIHEQLYSSNQFDQINVKIYIEQLLNQFANMTIDSGRNYVVKIPDQLNFNLETLFPLGLILTELIMNSIKHAELEPEKSLMIHIEIKELGNFYLLCYSDNGKGKLTNNKSMGSIILSSMSRQLNAKTREFNASGYNYNLEFVEKTTSDIVSATY